MFNFKVERRIFTNLKHTSVEESPRMVVWCNS